MTDMHLTLKVNLLGLALLVVGCALLVFSSSPLLKSIGGVFVGIVLGVALFIAFLVRDLL